MTSSLRINYSLCAAVVFLGLLLLLTSCSPESGRHQPNFILIYADDLGYGDLGCYGSAVNRTPHIDRMAAEGIRFTDFYTASGVCTPSRSSLMTGSYPQRVDLHLDSKNYWVLFPQAHKGLHPNEITIAELLKKEGYATACIGKWHLGDQEPFLPTRQGFDFYYGIPYSNDMGRPKIPLPLMRNETVIEAPADQTQLTKNYTREALKFISENQERPFFLYLPHTMPHVPLFSSEAFRGKSNNGKYGDAIEEIDWSTGRILEKLKELGLDENTIVIFTSDNGAAGRFGGSNAPLSGAKGNTDEGSMRVPFIARWPGQIPSAQECGELATIMDILPTFTLWAGGEVPTDRTLDGKDIRSLLLGQEGARSSYDAFFYYHTDQLQAVRSGKWKLILPQKVKKQGWKDTEENTPLRLINLEEDIREERDQSGEFPEIVEELITFADRARKDLGDLKLKGSGQRPAGRVENPRPLLK